jgi:hypothetical protein
VSDSSTSPMSTPGSQRSPARYRAATPTPTGGQIAVTGPLYWSARPACPAP